MSRVLFVGGTGYLGRKIIAKMLDVGYQITCTYVEGENVKEIFSKDINSIRCEFDIIKDELERTQYDWIINCAALYEKNDTKVYDIVYANSILGMSLLSLACDYNVKNVLTIDTSLPEQVNMYSFTKKKVSDLGKFLCQKYDINVSNVMPEMFYGLDEPINRFIPSSIKKMKLGECLELTKGKQIRDIIHISDVVNILTKIVEKEPKGYNDIPIGTGCGVSVYEIITYIHKCLNSQSVLKFGAIPERKHEPDCVADITKLRSIIGVYEYKYDWKTGLNEAIKGIEV